MNSLVKFSVLFFYLDLDPVFADYPEPKIVGGWQADIQQVPYFVRFEFTNRNLPKYPWGGFCGATIIHPQWLLTVAHCTGWPNPNDMRLILGVNDRNDENNMPRKGNLFPRVSLTICHPEYKEGTALNESGIFHDYSVNDICLLRTDHLLQFGKYINKALLPWEAFDQKFEDKELLVSGYGMTGIKNKGFYGDKLHSIKLKVLPRNECESLFNNPNFPPLFYGDNSICAKGFDEVLRATCYYDSGGGLLYEDSITGCSVLIGAVKGHHPGSYCSGATQFPLVSAYKVWIQNTLERYSYPPTKDDLPKYTYPRRNKFD